MFKLGKTPWNKGLKGVQKWTPTKYRQMKELMTGNSFSKGKNLGNTNARGHKPWNKGKKMPQLSNEKNSNWKGEKASYMAIHSWVRRHKGKPIKCIYCGKEKTTPKSIQWANRDHTYRRILDDYISLCVSCHRKYDIKYNGYSL